MKKTQNQIRRKNSKDLVEIVEETKDFIILDKPAHLSIHNDPGSDLLSIVASQLPVEEPSLAAAHRLDVGTSGLVICTKSKESAEKIYTLFSSHNIDKYYIAICKGEVKGPTLTKEQLDVVDENWITIDSKLTNRAAGRSDPRGLKKDRVDAITKYKVLSKNKFSTLVLVKLETGRTHQIRRHFAIIGHPLVGDSRYSKMNKERITLHSFCLKFTFEKTPYNVKCIPGSGFWALWRGEEVAKILVEKLVL